MTTTVASQVKGMRCLTDFTVTQQSASLKEASAHFERALERKPAHVLRRGSGANPADYMREIFGQYHIKQFWPT